MIVLYIINAVHKTYKKRNYTHHDLLYRINATVVTATAERVTSLNTITYINRQNDN